MVNTFAHFTYYPGNSLRLQMKRNIPPWPKLATLQYSILSRILYLLSIFPFALFAVPYPQFSNGVAAPKSKVLSTLSDLQSHSRTPCIALFCHCLGKKSHTSFKYNLLCHPITRPWHGRLLTALSSTLYTTPTLCRPPTYPHRQHHHRRFSREEQFHLSWKTSS